MKNHHSGFTLVEVIVVIILIGILAASVSSKFSGTDTYEPYTFRSQLISALRLTQQRAMQQTDGVHCHQIVFNNSRYGIPDRTNCAVIDISTLSAAQLDLTGAIVDDRYHIQFDINGQANPKRVSFDSMGRPLEDCDGGCIINIRQTETNENVSIKIESEGYIHAL